MNPKLLLCLALVLGGGLPGCSTAYRASAIGQTNAMSFYLYFGSEDGGSANRFLSARIHLDEEIFVGGDDFLELKGHIEKRGTNFIADLMGSTGQQGQFYRGNMTLEKPFFAQGGVASGGAGPPFWFLISTNSDCRTISERVNAVRGFTNAPFNHPVAILPPPVSNAPENIDPATGLPWGNRFVDPSTGLSTKPLDVRAALLASAKKNEPDFPDGRNLVLTHFAEVGSLVTLRGDVIYVIDQYSVTADTMAPHGQAFIVFFDNKFRFLGKIGYGRSSPLWCDGGKLYLRGDLDRIFYNSDLDKRLENISPGNVIDVAEGFENLTNYQAKVYGSSGGLDDK